MWRSRPILPSARPSAFYRHCSSISFKPFVEERTIWINGSITDNTVCRVVDQLSFLESTFLKSTMLPSPPPSPPPPPITLIINSPGGLVSAGLAIYDFMQTIKCPVSTVCLGRTASIATLLLAAGAPGRRCAFYHSQIMINQPSGRAFGQAIDIAIQAQHISKLRQRLSGIYSLHTGQPIERIERCLERDMFMSSEEAKEFGIVDELSWESTYGEVFGDRRT